MVAVRGVAPGFLLLPAREYSWELVNRIQIRIPIEGKISEVFNAEELATNVKIGGPDEFSIVDEDGNVYLWEIIRILFAQIKYPELTDDQCLNVVALVKNPETEELVIHGEILQSVAGAAGEGENQGETQWLV